MRTVPGQCRYCLRHRQVFRISRSGGGTYRRGGRSYWSSICGDCATTLLQYLGSHAGAAVSGFNGRTLRKIAAFLQEPETDPAKV